MRDRIELLVVTAIVNIAATAFVSAGETSTPKELQPMLKITWTEGPEYPMGIQESACGVLD
ncbi:MAG: hypothetical protein FJ272_22555, partial [Planctomycetes bacterium]|nr:hypothetical protein [Planctomycetota bacterium]